MVRVSPQKENENRKALSFSFPELFIPPVSISIQTLTSKQSVFSHALSSILNSYSFLFYRISFLAIFFITSGLSESPIVYLFASPIPNFIWVCANFAYFS